MPCPGEVPCPGQLWLPRQTLGWVRSLRVSPWGLRPCPGEDGAAFAPPPPFLSVLSPAPAPDGRWRCREVAALPTNPRGCLVPHAERCVQEELTSTSVEHLIINPNAAYEKFKDKRLSTEGVGEPGGSGKGGLWGPRGDPGEGTAALGVLG